MCKELLEDGQINKSVTVKIRNIISSAKRCAENEDLLYKQLTENSVSFTDACSCKKLFIIFLENSGNLLLARLLGAEVHKGRTGSTGALDDFMKIW
jgi:hypothetical protein